VSATREERILGIIETARGKRGKFRDDRVNMAHGAGGKATQSMIEGLFLPAFGSESLEAMGDAGAVSAGGAELALTTDSFVVKPIRFPGGSIGDLAVNGTVNDLAVAGARPLALSLSLILEEGLAADDLRAEVDAIAGAAEAAGVRIVAGDTKVVERGAADQMYVCTSGVGVRDPRARTATDAIRPGDRILLSGTVGEHGTAIMLARGEFELDAEIESDTRSLWPVADALLEEAGPSLRCMRDATRGGVASVLNELARSSQVAMLVREARCRSTRPWQGRPRSWGSTRCTWPTKASSSPSLPRRLPTGRLPRCARSRAASGRRRSARCARSRPRWCWSTPPSAASA
jgi:hydrogenase expression/formation protein HypE